MVEINNCLDLGLQYNVKYEIKKDLDALTLKFSFTE